MYQSSLCYDIRNPGSYDLIQLGSPKMSEQKSRPVTKNTIPNRPRLGLRGLGQVQVFAHNSLRTLTQQSSQKGITETENSQSLLRNKKHTIRCCRYLL